MRSKGDAPSKDINWGKVEESIQAKSDALTRGRLSSAPPSPAFSELSAQLEKSGIKLPSLSKAGLPAPSSEERALRALQHSDVMLGLKARASYNRATSQLQQLHRQVLKSSDVPPLAKQEIFQQIKEKKHEAQTIYASALNSSPEAFLAAHVADLRMLRRNYLSGRIIKTPYVREKVNDVTEKLATGKVVFISGETGIGKTEVARIAAKDFSGQEPLVVRGYAGMSSDELFGHMALVSAGDKDSQLKKIAAMSAEIDSSLKVFVQMCPEATEADKKLVVQGALSRSGSTVSEYILGSVYKAAQEGRVAIIDEANYIPPELLAKLNDIMTKRPGERINVQEDGLPPIEVKHGFGLVFTGNVNPPSGPLAKRYIGRHQFDLAFLDRVSMVPYSYLPQAVEGKPQDYAPEQKQLFQVAIATLLLPPSQRWSGETKEERILERHESRAGTALLPEAERGIDTVWRLTQFASATQRAFAGQIKDGDALGFNYNGTSVGHQPAVALSPRALIRVIEAWRDDGFQRELDHYIAEDLLDRALDPKDKAYLYQLGQFYGFFQSEGWNQNPDYDSAISRGVFNLSIPENNSPAADLAPARTVIAAIFGEIPSRTSWPDGKTHTQIVTQNDVAAWVARDARLEALKRDFKELGFDLEELGTEPK